MYRVLGKLDNFDFFGPNLLKNGFWGGNFINISLDSKSAIPREQVYQFSVKMDNSKFFGFKFWQINCQNTCDILALITLRVM